MKISTKKQTVFKAIDLSSKELLENVLPESENIDHTADSISCRPGISLSENPVIYRPEDFSSGIAPLHLTDFFLSIKGRKAQIALAVEDDGWSNIYYHFYAIYSDCTKDDLGSVTFTRSDYNTFGTPASYVMFSGKPTLGGGIYLLTRIVYSNGNPDETRMFEINSDLFGWTMLPSFNFYIPTLLIHGRGDNCNTAFLNTDIKLAVPRLLEPQNYLCPSYHLYYTTDGYSSSFTILNEGLLHSNVACTVTLKDGSEASFFISQNSLTSDPVTVNGNNVVMRLDRSQGRLFFQTEEHDEPFVLEYTATENNMKITVYPEDISDAVMLASMEKVINFTAKSAGNIGAVSLFSGSRTHPDKAIWMNPENPLYFPKSCTLEISTPSGIIGKMTDANGQLLIFKQNNVFSMNVTAADHYDLFGIIKGIADSGKVNFPTVSLKDRMTLSANVIPDTVKSYLGEICFCCEDNRIYRINRSLDVINSDITFSGNIDFATMLNSRYILAEGEHLYISDGDSRHLLHWRLPVVPIGAIDFGDKTVFFARSKAGLIYGFTLDGEIDTYIESSDTELSQTLIESTLKLKLAEEERPCKLYSLSCVIDSVFSARLRLYNGERFLGENIITEPTSFVHRPAIFDNLSAEFKMKGKSKISKISIKYSKLNKI